MTPNILLLTITFLLLTACGFTPLYGDISGKGQGSEAILAQISIANIPEREGQMLRNTLINRLTKNHPPAAAAKFHLDIDQLRENLRDLNITKDSDSTRGQLRLDTTMTLIDIKTKDTLFTRNLHAITSYNILGSEFASRVTEQNARENAIQDLANQIELQLALYIQKYK